MPNREAGGFYPPALHHNMVFCYTFSNANLILVSKSGTSAFVVNVSVNYVNK